MDKMPMIMIIISILMFVCIFAAYSLSGDGGLKRMTTLSGIYAVENPGGWPVVCFADKSSPEGGIDCVPKAHMTVNEQQPIHGRAVCPARDDAP